MRTSVRSCLTVGVATITAAAIALVPSVKEPVPVASHPSVVQVTAPAITLAARFSRWRRSRCPTSLWTGCPASSCPPSAGQPFPEPEFPPVIVGNSLGSSIKNIYNAVEPWVR